MATIILVPHKHRMDAGGESLVNALLQRGHEVSVAYVDSAALESKRDPHVTAVLHEHALAPKSGSEIFVVGYGGGADVAREAVAYLSKHGDTTVSGLVIIEPRVPFLVAPVRNTLSLTRTFFGSIVLGRSLLRDDLRFLLETPVLLRDFVYPTLHFYNVSEASVQQELGYRLPATPFTASHAVECWGSTILNSSEREVVIERIITWIETVSESVEA